MKAIAFWVADAVGTVLGIALWPVVLAVDVARCRRKLRGREATSLSVPP